MQKLKFINGNGIEIDLTDKVNYGIIAWEGFSADGLNIQSQQVPFQDGGVFLDALMEQRELSVTVAINAKGNLEKRYRLRRELISVLNPKLGEGVLIYTDNYLSKQIHVIPQIPLFDTNNSNDSGTPKVSCSFTACNPYWEDLEDTIVLLSKNKIETITNNGDIPTQMEIIFFTSNALNPKILNIDNNKKIEYRGTLSRNLIIDTNVGQKKVYSEDFMFNISEYHLTFSSLKYVSSIGMFLAVSSNYIIFSYDGIEWIYKNSGLQTGLLGIVYSAELNLYVAVGYSSSNTYEIITSPDGINWTEQVGTYSSISGIFKDVIYSSSLSLFVAVGNNGIIVTSSDGVNWTEQTSGIAYQLNKIIYCSDLEIFVAVGYRGIITSSDGIVWTSRYNVNNELFDIVYSKDLSLFVAVGDNGHIATSSNGTNWSGQSVFYNVSLRSVEYSSDLSLFVAVGENGHIATSSNGTNWTALTTVVNAVMYNVTYSSDLKTFVITGDSGLDITSSNGTNWVIHTVNDSCIIKDFVYSKELNKIVGVGNNRMIFTSTDGLKWVSHKVISDLYNLRGISYSAKLHLFVVVGEHSTFLTSSDGENWTQQETEFPFGASFYGVAYSPSLDLFVAVGDGGRILTSPDGIDWTEQIIQNVTTFRFVTFCSEVNMFIAGGVNGYILTSNDGLNWVIRYQNDSIYFCSDIVYSYELKLFVVVCYNSNVVLTSTDGINWKERLLSAQYGIYSVDYSPKINLFLAVGSSGAMLSSSDGMNWEELNNDIVTTLSSVIYDIKSNMFIVGGNGIIFYTSFTEAENQIQNITPDSDVGLNIPIGENRFRILTGLGDMTCRISFRQKYIGV